MRGQNRVDDDELELRGRKEKRRGGAFVEVTADTALAAGDQAYLCGNAESLKAAAAVC